MRIAQFMTLLTCRLLPAHVSAQPPSPHSLNSWRGKADLGTRLIEAIFLIYVFVPFCIWLCGPYVKFLHQKGTI